MYVCISLALLYASFVCVCVCVWLLFIYDCCVSFIGFVANKCVMFYSELHRMMYIGTREIYHIYHRFIITRVRFHGPDFSGILNRRREITTWCFTATLL